MISICVKNLNKCYRVREGNLGEFVSIVGPSGCGKSTLLYILGGFIRADSGVIEVGGKAVTGPGTDRGVVFQEYALFPWLTVTQNIRYGLEMTGVARREREETVRRLVRTIGLEGFEHRFPRELSGGMKQRVAIARTLAYDPNILLLDEPFGALDAQTRETMQDELLRLWQATRKTVVMVTHDVNEAVYLSDRVLVMSQRPGRIVAKFTIAIDRSGNRETTMLNADFNAVRNEVWLAVRRQVAATIAA
jgi:NitT/TauT family transport system ATP-binding protein